MRHSVRNFRLDRMDALELLSGIFQRPAQFSGDTSSVERGKRFLKIRALFDPAVTRWVREARYFFVTEMEDKPDGLLVTLQVRQEDEVLQWLLGWGAAVQVLDPESLRQRLANEAERMMRIYRGIS
jgi:predicted DNA-binding transcriptional regulator YafY